MAAKQHQKWPPFLSAMMTGVRVVESGGNYNEPNGQGGYQILQSNWPAWVTAAGYPQYAHDPNASDAPPEIQDRVAAYKLTEYYYGAGEKNWRLVARIWNGGTPNIVPNPAICAGCTTDDYADRVLGIAQDAAGNADPGSAIWAEPPSALDPRNAIPGHKPSDPLNPPRNAVVCQHKLDFKIGSVCMDKTIAGLAMAGGSVLILAGVALFAVATLERTAAGQAARQAVAPFAGAAAGARAARGRRTRAAQIDADRVAARSRTEEAHQTRIAGQRAAQTRAEAAEARRRTDARRRARHLGAAERRRAEAHTTRMSTRLRSAADRPAAGRSFPGLNAGRSNASIRAANRARHGADDKPPF